MSSRGIALACIVFCCSASLRAEDLVSLVREYGRAVGKVGGSPQDRASKVAKHVTPVLDKIGALGGAAALGWLVGELDKKTVPVEVRAAIPPAIVRSGGEKGVRSLLRGLGRRPVAVQSASVKALRRAETKLDVDDVQLLLSQLGSSSRSSKGPDSNLDEVLVDVVELLRSTKDPELREWLADDAYSTAGSHSGRLFVLARLAAELRLAGARERLSKLVNHRSPMVSSAAIEALGAVGVGDSATLIAKAIRRGRGDLRMRIKALDSLASSGGDALDVVIESAKGGDSELRAVAMGSLALATGNRKAMDTLLEGLDDKDPSVRAVAMRSLSRVRYKPMIGALIGVLESSKDRSFRIKALELLVKLSGQNFGAEIRDWRKWWNVAGENFEFPEGTAKAFTNVKAYDLSYFGIEVSSKRMGFLVDISSSMREMVAVKEGALDEPAGDGVDGRGRTRAVPPRRGGKRGGGKVKDGKAMKIDVLKRELSRLIRKLPADVFVNIVCFDAAFKAWQKTLQPIRGKGRARAVGYVENLNTGSGTNVFDTLEFALKDKRVDTIYLLTDGKPTRGRITDPGAILAEIKTLNRVRGITLHTIAFGEPSDLLEKLAEQNGGQYRFVDRY